MSPSSVRKRSCRRRLLRVLHACVAFTCASVAQGALASELAVEWSAPVPCPDRSALEARVARSLGGVSAPPDMHVSVAVTQLSDTFHARVRIRSSLGSGERALEDASCEILADSVALVIALSVTSTHTDDARSSRLRVAISAHGSASVGMLPAPALGLGGALAIEGIWALRFELSATYFAEQSARFEQVNAGASFRTLRFGARACRLWQIGLIELAPCLGAELYRIEGRGFGGVAQRRDTSYVPGVALDAFGRLRLSSSFAVFIAARGVVPLSRQRFVYRDLGPLHRPAALTFEVLLGPELRF